MKTDASVAKGIASRNGIGKVRHIEVCQLWLQDKVRLGEIVIVKVDGKDNAADAVAKPLSAEDSKALNDAQPVERTRTTQAMPRTYGRGATHDR